MLRTQTPQTPATGRSIQRMDIDAWKAQRRRRLARLAELHAKRTKLLAASADAGGSARRNQNAEANVSSAGADAAGAAAASLATLRDLLSVARAGNTLRLPAKVRVSSRTGRAVAASRDAPRSASVALVAAETRPRAEVARDRDGESTSRREEPPPPRRGFPRATEPSHPRRCRRRPRTGRCGAERRGAAEATFGPCGGRTLCGPASSGAGPRRCTGRRGVGRARRATAAVV